VNNEIWRDIPGFEGAYQVSDLGRVRGLGRTVYHQGGRRFVCERILRPGSTRSGHYHVVRGRGGKGGKHIIARVHALVLLAFVGPRPQELEIRHLNGIPTDNRLINLEYATRSRNRLDIKWHDGNALRPLTPQDVLRIKQRLDFVTNAELAQEYKVSASTISDIRCGRTHKDVALGEFDNGGDL